MIVVKKSPEPPSLVKARQAMEAQVDKAQKENLTIELLKKSAKPKNTPGVLEIKLNDDLYKPSEAKAQLILDHLGKCAYCESRFMDTAGGDVEHFRPKKGFNEFDRLSSTGLGPRTKLGYFFLAYSWDNHLWACKECNETYKKNYFGVMPDMSAPPDRDDFSSDTDFDDALQEWASAVTKHREWSSGSTFTEESILIDPSKENPREHIQFDPQSGYAVGAQLDDKGKMMAPSHRGGATILYLGLNREELVFARARHLTLLRGIFVEMTRYRDLVLEFLQWQRGSDWEDEAKQSLSVPREGPHGPVEGPPEIERARKARREAYEEKLKARGITLEPWAPSYDNMQLEPTDEPVPMDRRQPDPGPYFSKKAKVVIPGQHTIQDDPTKSPLDFLIYSVTPRAVFSALAADALAAWSLELAEHLVRPIDFVAQLNRPETKAPEPNRATVSLLALDTHQAILNFYMRDYQVFQALADNHRIERAVFDAGSDTASVCFVCRKILATAIEEHRKLERALTGRHTPEYDRAWLEHAHKLDELENTFKLYGCARDDWASAVQVMDENLDNYPPDLCHDITPALNGLVQAHNDLVRQVTAPGNPWWYQNCDIVLRHVGQMITALEGRNAQNEPEYATATALRSNLASCFGACHHTDWLNGLIDTQQFIMGYVGVRNIPDYATYHARATQDASDLENGYSSLGVDIPGFADRLGQVKAGLQAFPPDPAFVQGTPQPMPQMIMPLGPPPAPGDITELDYQAPPPWQDPSAKKLMKKDYLGYGNEPAVYEQVRYGTVKG